MRKEGYYWVKFAGVWWIAHYSCFHWHIYGYNALHESVLDEIDERMIERKE